MIQLKDIRKEYKTGGMTQRALDGISLTLREKEFVSILGPSGSGKTTLLNTVGGLDRYDSGDIIIDGRSTKDYNDRDWDTYRNHSVGFVFQSYNLIPHQTILANVELALTIAGVSKTERKIRAKEALEKVGLSEHINKLPSQLSGGQMQRVAIARALVNNPDILLADEPTGALDSETGIVVMELLKEISKDHLVVMVTHNAELAREYSTRIIELKDGRIISDSHPLNEDEKISDKKKPLKQVSMSFLTALSLSFNNLRSKLKRTMLVGFAGSIGIIGIALILALSNGTNNFIKQTEEEMLGEYPLSIYSSSIDLASSLDFSKEENSGGELTEVSLMNNIFSNISKNDLASFKKHIESGESGIPEKSRSVEYDYDIVPTIFLEQNGEYNQVNPDLLFGKVGFDSSSALMSSMSLGQMGTTSAFYQMPADPDIYQGSYDLKAGKWPEKYNELVLVTRDGGLISDFVSYSAGVRKYSVLDEMVDSFIKGDYVGSTKDEKVTTYKYSDFIGREFSLILPCDKYEYDSKSGIWIDKSNNSEYMDELAKNAEKLTIVGVAVPASGSLAEPLLTGMDFLPSLQKHIIEKCADSEIVKAQLASPDINVLTNQPFSSDESSNGLNLSSLFGVDEDAFMDALGISDTDTSLPSFDLGNMQLIDPSVFDDLSAYFPDLTSEDIADLALGSLSGSAGSEIATLFKELIGGYFENADTSGIINSEQLQKGLRKYISNNMPETLIPDPKEIDFTFDEKELEDRIWKYITDNNIGGVTREEIDSIVNIDALTEKVTSLLESYAAGEISDDEFREGYRALLEEMRENTGKLSAFLTALSQLSPKDAIAEIIGGYITEKILDPDMLSVTLMEYLDSVSVEELVEILLESMDTEAMEQSITEYLTSESTREIIKQAVAEMFDTDALSSKLMKSLGADEDDSAVTEAINQATTSLVDSLTSGITDYMALLTGGGVDSLADLFSFDESALNDAFSLNISMDELYQMINSLLSGGVLDADSNLKSFGYANEDNPYSITIYPKDFNAKEGIIKIINDYNTRVTEEGHEEKAIEFTDLVGTMTSSITDIVNIVSYVLIAFVAISLIVSSIMIAVITYISVFERRKEIGILRALGASKKNISGVFNAETFITGALSGLIGIIVTLILTVIANIILGIVVPDIRIAVALPITSAFGLFALSVGLNVLSGLIPAHKAAKSDPVIALRGE